MKAGEWKKANEGTGCDMIREKQVQKKVFLPKASDVTHNSLSISRDRRRLWVDWT